MRRQRNREVKDFAQECRVMREQNGTWRMGHPGYAHKHNSALPVKYISHLISPLSLLVADFFLGGGRKAGVVRRRV